MTLAWTILGSAMMLILFVVSLPMVALAAAAVGMGRQGNKVEKKLLLPYRVSFCIFLVACFSPFWTIALAWICYVNGSSVMGYLLFLIPFPSYVIGMMLQEV